MKIALIDDEPIFLNALESTLKTALEKSGIYCFTIDKFDNSADFLKVWKPFSYDLIFLDIFIDEINGIDIGRHIREADDKVNILFCSTSNDYAMQSYELNASYYMTKPLSEDAVTSMLKRINLKRMNKTQKITLPDGYSCLLYDIIYTEYSNHSVTLYMESCKPHSLYISQSSMEEILLSYDDFVVINRGNIVNLQKVDRLEKDCLYLYCGTYIPVSRSKYKSVSKRYADYKLKKISEDLNSD